MSLFTWLFSLGRTRGKGGKRHTAGRWLLPAAVQRAHLEIANLDLPRGCIQRIDGTYAAVARIAFGFPQHARGNDETMRHLREIARALNALPTQQVVMIARARPGGLERYAIETRQRHAALPDAHPLRRLLVDQTHHALARMQAGQVRETHQYLVAHGKTAVEAATRLTEALSTLETAGVRGAPTTNRALLDTINASWKPRAVEHFVADFRGPDGDVVCSLAYSPGNARVTQPRYGAQETTNHAPSLAAPAPGSLPRPRAARTTARATTTKPVAAAARGALPSGTTTGRTRLATSKA